MNPESSEHTEQHGHPDNHPEHPVFFDPTRRRAVLLGRIVAAVAVVIGGVLAIFWASVFAVPAYRTVHLPMPRFLPDNQYRDAIAIDAVKKVKTAAAADAAKQKEAAKNAAQRRKRPHTPLPPALADGTVPGRGQGVVGGFYVNWDNNSLASLRQHASEMTHLFPGWLHLNENGSRVVFKDSDPTDLEAIQIARENHVQIVPLFNNFSNETSNFDDARLHDLLVDPNKQKAVIAQILNYLQKNHFRGVNIDLETNDDDDRALLSAFMARLSAALRPHNLLVTADAQTDDPEQAAAMARYCDFVIPMIYDLHWATGESGPIAPQAWAKQQLNDLLNMVPASKVVLAIGNYAYNWQVGKQNAQTLTFGEAMATAHESQDATDGILKMDPASRNPFFTYDEDDGSKHIVWLLDSVTAYNLQRYAESKGVSGRALWYVGSEDPTLWSFFGKDGSALTVRPSALSTVHYGFEIDFEGEGEILDVASQPQDGKRRLTLDPTSGDITDERFDAYPTTYIVRRSGQHKDDQGHLKRELALTFDDGPDPRWTPAVLDALHDTGAVGTFFVIGVNAEQRPDLLRREWDEGNEIGNHTFYHPNIAQVTPTRMRLEIDATQRVIQSAIGRSTPLFRPPFGIDVEPATSDELIPVVDAQRHGYVTVAEGIDPRDWEAGPKKHTAEQIADTIVWGAATAQGNVVLLHDGGGDREATAEALRLAIPRLKAKGFKFVTVSQLLNNGKSRDALFPKVEGRQKLLAELDSAVFGASSWSGRFLTVIFLVSLIAGTIRLIAVALLALMHVRREREREAAFEAAATPASELPTVSVVIAAYNEEKVIERTIHALLDGDYPHLEVIVVDDGSKDDTSGVVKRVFGSEPRVRLIQKPNGGKASALNTGIAYATGAVLVGLDADTLFAPDTVYRLARHFADPRVGAVAGNIQIGNRHNLLTRWQSVEYTTSQNFDRRAYEMLNAIPVIPGAVSAWRADAVRAAGGYATDTLAEDADLTWRVLRAGWRTISDSTAYAYTEAPEHLKDLMKQRFRWTFGTLQTMFKHRDLLLRPSHGAFGMVVAPSLWLFQVLLPLALPFADLGVLMAAFAGNMGPAIAYCCFFFVAEFSAACLAFSLDRAPFAKRLDLLLLPLQRVVWRYLLFWILCRSLGAALRGSRAGWGKLDRRGTATIGGTGTGSSSSPASTAPTPGPNANFATATSQKSDTPDTESEEETAVS